MIDATKDETSLVLLLWHTRASLSLSPEQIERIWSDRFVLMVRKAMVFKFNMM